MGLAALFAAAGAVAAACPAETTPARFGRGPEALNQLIEFPRGYARGEPVVLRCDFSVLKSGVAVFGACQRRQGELEDFESALERAVEAARFLPARADGKPVRTVVQVTAVFRGPGDVFVLPNASLMASEYGNAYIAPQRIIEPGQRWRPLRLQVGPERDLELDYQGYANVEVGSDGRPTAVHLDLDREISRDSRAEAIGEFESACFVPGLTRDGPQPMRYRELIWK